MALCPVMLVGTGTYGERQAKSRRRPAKKTRNLALQLAFSSMFSHVEPFYTLGIGHNGHKWP